MNYFLLVLRLVCAWGIIAGPESGFTTFVVILLLTLVVFGIRVMDHPEVSNQRTIRENWWSAILVLTAVLGLGVLVEFAGVYAVYALAAAFGWVP